MLVLKKIPDKEYFAIDALSSSGIKELLKSPRHLRYMLTKGFDPATPAMRLGTLVHGLILGASVEVAVFEGKSLHSKAADAFIDTNKDKFVVTAGEMEEAQTIVAAQKDRPIFNLFSKTENEVAIVGQLEGLPVKAKADALYRDLKMIIDLKTCSSIPAFKKNFLNFGYHIQAAWYCHLFSKVTPIEDFVFWAVETEPPYEAMSFRLTDELHDHALAQVAGAVILYQECIARNEWAGYTEEIQEIGLPAWLKNNINL